jgi:hypothetical protein
MVTTFLKQLLAATLSVLLVIPAGAVEAAGQQPAPPAGSPPSAVQGAHLSAADLEQLVAPIALYPDALVAQVLGAATFPDQVTAADGWLQKNKNLTGSTLMQAVDKQPWDPSVKALTQFPSVLDNMTKNLSWTSALGEAYHTQAADVMTAVQALRAMAKAAGVAAGDCDSANQSAGGVRPAVQPHGCLWSTSSDSRIQLRGHGSDRYSCVWRWHCCGRGDQ